MLKIGCCCIRLFYFIKKKGNIEENILIDFDLCFEDIIFVFVIFIIKFVSRILYVFLLIKF